MGSDLPSLPGLVAAAPDLLVLGLDTDRAPLGAPVVVAGQERLARLAGALRDTGWRQDGTRWARFADGTAEQVVLLRCEDPPPPGEPLLHDELRLRALAAPAAGARVPDRYRQEAHRRLATDASAWLRAHDTARPEQRTRVVSLQDAYETGLPLGMRAGAAEPGWPGAVVALSGLDGAGKTTQAHLLAHTLLALGHDPAVEWARLGFAPALDRVAAPLKRLRRRGSAHQVEAPPEETEPTGARRTVRRPAPVDAAWSVVVAGADVADARQRRRRHAPAGRVVVRDRYLLDSLVHLPDRYGGDSTTAAARAVLRSRLPAATCSFLLELPAAEAFARKPGEWSRADLERHAARYAEGADRLGVTRLDARRPPHELAAVIAEAVWRHLP